MTESFPGDNHGTEVPIVDLDPEDEVKPPPDRLARIVNLARLQMDQERAVSYAEEALETAKSALRQTAEVDLPDALIDAGMGGIPLETGEEVEIVKSIHAGITEARADEAHAWFENEGYGDIIKHEVKITLPRETADVVERIIRSLTKFNDELPKGKRFKIKSKRAIHPQTLQKFVRDAEAGKVELPEELLGVYRRRVAKITYPKEKF